MAINNVSFGQEQQQKQSSGILFPALGALGVGGVTAAIEHGKGPKLETLDKDVFVNATKDFTGDDKAAAKTVQDYISSKPSTGAAETAKKGAKVASESAPAASNASVAVDKFKVEDAFHGKKAIEEGLEFDDYLGRKYGVYDNGSLSDRIKQAQTELQSANFKKEINVAQSRVSNVNYYAAKAAETRKVQETIDSLNAEKTALKEQAKSLDIASPEFKRTSARITNIETSIAKQNEQLSKIDATLTKVQKQADVKKFSMEQNVDIHKGKGKTYKELADEAITKAKSQNGRIGTEVTRAEKEALQEFQSEAVRQARKTAKGKLSAEKIKEIEDLVSIDKAADIKKAGEIAGQKAENKLMSELTSKYSKNYYEKVAAQAKGNVTHSQRALAKKEAAIAEMQADLDLTKAAKKEGTKITKEAAESTIGTGVQKAKSTIKEAVENVPKKVADAFEKIKGKLPKKMNWGKVAGFAGIGLAAGIVIKMMTDSSNKQQA